MHTTAAKQEFAVLEVFRTAGGTLRNDEISERVRNYALQHFNDNNLTIYPRGLGRVVEGFRRSGILERRRPGSLTITERGLSVKRDIYDRIIANP